MFDTTNKPMQETNREKNELYSHINFKENDDGLVVENAQKGGRGTIGRGERSDPDTGTASG